MNFPDLLCQSSGFLSQISIGNRQASYMLQHLRLRRIAFVVEDDIHELLRKEKYAGLSRLQSAPRARVARDADVGVCVGVGVVVVGTSVGVGGTVKLGAEEFRIAAVTVAEWLEHTHQPASVRESFWGPLAGIASGPRR